MKIIITRHKALIELLIERGIVPKETPVFSHAKAEEIKGKDVYGVLPLSLAVHANTVTEIPLDLTPEMRGKELDLDTLRKIAGDAKTYKVCEL